MSKKTIRALGVFALVTMLALSLLLTACTATKGEPANTGADANASTGANTNTDANANTDDGRISIIATIFAPYDFARQVAGDKADLRMLVPPGAETHSFEPTPRDILAIEQCDVFIYVGGESDEWVDDLLSSINTSNVTTIRLVESVPTVEEDDSVLVNPAEAEEEEEEGAVDEHVWTAPANAKLITEAIARALEQVDPANASTYQENATSYLAKLDELDAEFRGIVADGKRTTLVFGDRFPFRYFADEYGLTCYAAFPGCSTATEASAQTVAALIDIVRTEGIPVVFYRELSEPKIAEAIAAETGVQALLFHSCHNIGQADFDAGETYLSIMERNADNLRIALN
ncbi:MAG: metal ABC transporter substrate-binding protein [Coriobacteriales bacterium]|jgi:zinc transport system substrate-binding protein|nr:metal ABC transporter substrate-binding protein [Coriobacteriales bacterium]